jgi:hypothetical protein
MHCFDSITGKGLLSILAVMATSAHAENTNWFGHIRAGPMVGLNISAKFSTAGRFNLAENLPAGTFNDGYVRTDQTGNSGGLTSNWGYQNASQVDTASHSLLMHQATTYSVSTSGNASDEPYLGAEIADGGTLWCWDQVQIGWELGCGILPISINHQQSFTANVNRNSYSFNTGSIVVPTAPYNGGPSGIGPLISATGTQLASDTFVGAFRDNQNLQATMVAFKLGPTFFWDLSHVVGLQAGAGPAVAILPGGLKFDDSVQLPDGSMPVTSGRMNSTPVTFGGYVNLVATFHVAKNVDFYLGGQYMPMDSAKFGGNGREAELKLTGQVNFMAGLNWPF